MTIELDVFLDESGVFLEMLPQNEQGSQGIPVPPRLFSSQFGGIVAKHGTLTPQRAGEILAGVCDAAGISLGAELHAKELTREALSRIVPLFCERIREAEYQAIRLVNRERVDFGDRKQTYCNMFAELLVKICERWDSSMREGVKLYVHSAKWVSEIVDDRYVVLPDEDYLAQVRPLFARTALAHGFSIERFQWRLEDLHVWSAASDRRLQMADLISYASHDNFSPLKDYLDAKEAMKSRLEGCDWSLSINETLKRVEHLQASESYGLAFIILAEKASITGINASIAGQYKSVALNLVKSIGRLQTGIQKAHFQVIAGWLNKIAEDRCALEDSLKKIEWIYKILCPIPEPADWPKGWPSDWLGLLTATYALAACNHAGNTLTGSKYSNLIEGLIPKAASRWEYADDLMFAMITQAVHRNDCCDYFEASKQMESVGKFYSTMNTFFQDAFPGVFPNRVHADLAGRAYGTQVQCEVACALASPNQQERDKHLDIGRQASDLAIEEFESETDRARQWQYRCELETAAGAYSEARRYLALALGAQTHTHDAISERLSQLPIGFGQGFLLLHWCRIGAMAGKSHDQREFEAFQEAWKNSSLRNSTWSSGLDLEGGLLAVYPSHGILRHLSVIAAAAGDRNLVQRCLANLERVVQRDRRPLFELISIAANMETLALLKRDQSASRNGLNELSNQISNLHNKVREHHPTMAKMLSDWKSDVDHQIQHGIHQGKLLSMGKTVGY
jgi:hypothetical protein